MSTQWVNLLVVLGLTSAHIFSKYFKIESLNRFSSLSAGVGISYVFLHLLPVISQADHVLHTEFGFNSTRFLYIIPLSSFSFFYVLDHLVITEWGDRSGKDSGALDNRLFWVHIIFFMIYNAVIGYYFTTETWNLIQLLAVFLAFSLHFITNDWALRHHHEQIYDKYGRIFLSLSILLGYLFGAMTNFPELMLELAEAFILGGLLLNTFKRELPSEKESSVPAFLSGVIVSGVLFSLF